MMVNKPAFSVPITAVAGDFGDTPAMTVRVILFVDEQANGAVPLATDLLQTVTATAHLNPNNRERFKVLMDKEICLDSYGFKVWGVTGTETRWGIDGGAASARCGKKYKKLTVSTIYNGGATADIGSIQTGALYLLVIADPLPLYQSAAGSYPYANQEYPRVGCGDGNILQMEGNVRCRFDDQ